MKNKTLAIIKSVLAVAALAIIATSVYAWTPPSTGTVPPAGNVPAPVNTGSFSQIKSGSLGTLQNFFAGIQVSSPQGRFGCLILCNPGTNDVLVAGKYNSNVFGNGLTVQNTGKTLIGSGNISNGNFNGLVIDPAGDFSAGNRLSWFTKGLQVSSGGDTTITGPLTITSGNPGAGKVLTSSDGVGNAVWGDASEQWMTPNTIEVGMAGSAAENGDDGPAVISVSVACPTPGSTIISGGGQCNRYAHTGPLDLQPTMIRSTGDLGSRNSLARWTVTCAGPAGTSFYPQATVLCVKASAGGGGGGGRTPTPTPTPTLDWQNVTLPAGNLNETCESWLGSLYDGDTTHVRGVGNFFGPTGFGPITFNGGCVYKYDNAQSGVIQGGFPYQGKYCQAQLVGQPVTGARPVASCNDTGTYQVNRSPNTWTSGEGLDIHTEVKR